MLLDFFERLAFRLGRKNAAVNFLSAMMRKDIPHFGGCTVAGYPARAAIEGWADTEAWTEDEKFDKLYEKYEHPLWNAWANSPENGRARRHGFHHAHPHIECLHAGEPLDQNICEGAMWSSVRPLRSQSEQAGGAQQKLMDFTRGNWQTTRRWESSRKFKAKARQVDRPGGSGRAGREKMSAQNPARAESPSGDSLG